MWPCTASSGRRSATPHSHTSPVDVPAASNVPSPLSATAQGIADALRGMALRPDSTPDLPRWRARTLVVCGEQDQLIPRAACDSLARNVPGGRQAIVSGAGHLAFLERPDDVMAELRWLLGA